MRKIINIALVLGGTFVSMMAATGQSAYRDGDEQPNL